MDNTKEIEMTKMLNPGARSIALLILIGVALVLTGCSTFVNCGEMDIRMETDADVDVDKTLDTNVEVTR